MVTAVFILLSTAELPAQTPTAEPAAETVRIMSGSTMFQRFQQGGATMIVLLALSVVGFSCALERVVRLQKKAINPRPLLDEAMSAWKAKDFTAVQAACKRYPSVLANAITAFVRHRTCPTLELSTIVSDITGGEMRAHLQRAYPLAVVATLSPLLGLLGTVIGMIDAFEVVAIAGSLGDASLLAGGISKALVTTALGLIISIPALGLYHYFKNRTQKFASSLERDVNELIATWFMEGRDASAPEVRA